MKEFLSQKGVMFTDRNIFEDDAAREELMRLEYTSVPVMVIDGQTVIGFDRHRIEHGGRLSWTVHHSAGGE